MSMNVSKDSRLIIRELYGLVAPGFQAIADLIGSLNDESILVKFANDLDTQRELSRKYPISQSRIHQLTIEGKLRVYSRLKLIRESELRDYLERVGKLPKSTP